MEMILKKIIGRNTYTFVFTGSNLYEAVTESQKLSFPDVHKCGICGSDDLTLAAHKAQDKYKYTHINCNNPKCRAQLTLGQRQDDPDTFYLRKNDKNEYDWKLADLTPNGGRLEQESQAPAQTESKPVTPPAAKTSQANHVKQTKSTAAAPKINNTADGKPSGKAINYATKISTAKDMKQLNAICGKVKEDKTFNEIDIIYLRNECVRKRNFLNNPQA